MAKLVLTLASVLLSAIDSSTKNAGASANPGLKIILQQPLITPGPNIVVTSVVLTLPPGDQGSPPHYHSGPTIGYVIEGEFLFQIKGQPQQIIKAGGTFFEYDRDIHVWGANANNSTTCKVVATVYGRPGENFVTILKDHPRESFEVAKAMAKKKQHSAFRCTRCSNTLNLRNYLYTRQLVA